MKYIYGLLVVSCVIGVGALVHSQGFGGYFVSPETRLNEAAAIMRFVEEERFEEESYDDEGWGDVWGMVDDPPEPKEADPRVVIVKPVSEEMVADFVIGMLATEGGDTPTDRGRLHFIDEFDLDPIEYDEYKADFYARGLPDSLCRPAAFQEVITALWSQEAPEVMFSECADAKDVCMVSVKVGSMPMYSLFLRFEGDRLAELVVEPKPGSLAKPPEWLCGSQFIRE